jgi:hypothetical protein
MRKGRGLGWMFLHPSEMRPGVLTYSGLVRQASFVETLRMPAPCRKHHQIHYLFSQAFIAKDRGVPSLSIGADRNVYLHFHSRIESRRQSIGAQRTRRDGNSTPDNHHPDSDHGRRLCSTIGIFFVSTSTMHRVRHGLYQLSPRLCLSNIRVRLCLRTVLDPIGMRVALLRSRRRGRCRRSSRHAGRDCRTGSA